MTHEIQEFVLTNSSGSRLSVLNLGLILHSCLIKLPDGSERDTVLGLQGIQDYRKPEYLSDYPYFGAIIGRYANRISNAFFKMAGATYSLVANNGKHCLHGGYTGFDQRFWDIEWLEQGRSLIATYWSPHQEEGFPGNLTCKAKISWSDDHVLTLHLIAETDFPTPVNLTWHPYFNLSREKHDLVEKHQLQLFSDRYLIQHEDLAPTGDIGSVKRSPLDFTTPNVLKEGIELGGIDTSFIIDGHDGTLKKAAILTAPDQMLALEASTDAPIIHLYTGENLPSYPIRGRNSQPFAGVCLECQQYTDAVNHPHFPNTILHPGDQYQQTIQYAFLFNPNT